MLFQSTLPVWGATFGGAHLVNGSHISIHAPRVGSDHQFRLQNSTRPDFNPRSPCGERRFLPDQEDGPAQNFNPRSPCGERLDTARAVLPAEGFQSTLPVWGATVPLQPVVFPLFVISIHAPRVGSDHAAPQQRPSRADFNPRSPCGERLRRRGNLTGG